VTTLPSLRLYNAGGVALYSPSRVEHLALGLGRCCAAAAASNGGGFFPADFAPWLVALSSGDVARDFLLFRLLIVLICCFLLPEAEVG